MFFGFRSALFFLVIASSPFFSSFLKAEVVFDNLAPGGGATTNDKNFANISRWAQGFTSNAAGFVTNVKLNIYTTNSQTGLFTVELWSDGGTNPNAKLATLKTLNWSTDVPLNNTSTNTSQYVEITSFEENFNIDNGVTYWLVINQAANGPFAKRWTVNGTGIGQTASYNFNTSTWTNTGSASNLSGQITVAVPEPGTILLGSSALLLVFGAMLVTRSRRIVHQPAY